MKENVLGRKSVPLLIYLRYTISNQKHGSTLKKGYLTGKMCLRRVGIFKRLEKMKNPRDR